MRGILRLQHANMALDVTVESPEAFATWREAQLKAGDVTPPVTLAQSGQQVFIGSAACASCHQITGTDAAWVRPART
jgi:cytochrome c oxidase subunit 2